MIEIYYVKNKIMFVLEAWCDDCVEMKMDLGIYINLYLHLWMKHFPIPIEVFDYRSAQYFQTIGNDRNFWTDISVKHFHPIERVSFPNCCQYQIWIAALLKKMQNRIKLLAVLPMDYLCILLFILPINLIEVVRESIPKWFSATHVKFSWTASDLFICFITL